MYKEIDIDFIEILC